MPLFLPKFHKQLFLNPTDLKTLVLDLPAVFLLLFICRPDVCACLLITLTGLELQLHAHCALNPTLSFYVPTPNNREILFADLPANTSIIEIAKDFDYQADESGSRLWKQLTDLYFRLDREAAADARKEMPTNEFHRSFAVVHNKVNKIMSAMTCIVDGETKTITVDLLATHYAYENKGLASILIEHLKRRCPELKVERIKLSPLEDVIEFYTKRGFKSYGLNDHSRTFEVSNHDELPSGILEFFVEGDAGRKKWQEEFESFRGYFDEYEG